MCKFMCVCFFFSVCKLICVLSRSSVETDNVVYLLSSCLDEEIRRSVFAWVCGNVWACTFVFVCVCVCVCVHKRMCMRVRRAIDKLSVVPLSLSDRILMLIPMVNSPETFHGKLIRPLSIIYTVPAFRDAHTHTKQKHCMWAWFMLTCAWLRLMEYK